MDTTSTVHGRHGEAGSHQHRRLPGSPSRSDDFEVSHLESLLTESTPEVLEAAVKVGVDLLSSLDMPLDRISNEDTTHWKASTHGLIAQSKPARTVVGVVGNTGAGKSSVINALLDEERLLPTNCLRACTASPTEISYNYSDDPAELYRAEIEFITPDDWRQELDALLTDLLDGNGNVSKEIGVADSDASIAYAKIKAVYPTMTKEMIANRGVDLAQDRSVRGILGTTKMLKAAEARSLYGQMQRYVDSKEKTVHPNSKDARLHMEYWPLIKVVRIHTKARALELGTVIVDLPGVQDSNAARAAVAQNYMKACTGLWIVAPITRAVDDKTAKSLLGDTFKRQLKYDGAYSTVTFICSKTDDISVTEAVENLGLFEVSESWNRAECLKQDINSVKSQMKKLTEQRQACQGIMDRLDDESEVWENLAHAIASGRTVYAPREKTKKRKRPARRSTQSRKNFRSSDTDDDISDSDSESSGSDKENSQPMENQIPLTEDEVEEKLRHFKTEKTLARQGRNEAKMGLSELKGQKQALTQEREQILVNVKGECIKARNNHSREAIKYDFAMGIKELDQEAAIEQNVENFDPEEELRDYEEVARMLPVFCVSSRSYQALSGRLEKDEVSNTGFQQLEETEIPQLQDHARKLTEAGRIVSCRKFLNEFNQLMHSMKLWASTPVEEQQSSQSDEEAEEKERRLNRFENALEYLRKELRRSVRICDTALQGVLHDNIYQCIGTHVPVARNQALTTATGWGAHRTQGGLFWATYKAVCRRNGVYSSPSAGPKDWNAELIEPIYRNLASKWERTFQHRIPRELELFAKSCVECLKYFHGAITQETQPWGPEYAPALRMLTQQLSSRITSIENIPTDVNNILNEHQRDANRQFTPPICHAMMPAYKYCADESGPGSFARMKSYMVEHVETSRDTMFDEAAGHVMALLANIVQVLNQTISATIEGVIESVVRDYTMAILRRSDSQSQRDSQGMDSRSLEWMEQTDDLARKHIITLLDGVDGEFEKVIPERDEGDNEGEDMRMGDESSQESDEGSQESDEARSDFQSEVDNDDFGCGFDEDSDNVASEDEADLQDSVMEDATEADDDGSAGSGLDETRMESEVVLPGQSNPPSPESDFVEDDGQSCIGAAGSTNDWSSTEPNPLAGHEGTFGDGGAAETGSLEIPDTYAGLDDGGFLGTGVSVANSPEEISYLSTALGNESGFGGDVPGGADTESGTPNTSPVLSPIVEAQNSSQKEDYERDVSQQPSLSGGQTEETTSQDTDVSRVSQMRRSVVGMHDAVDDAGTHMNSEERSNLAVGETIDNPASPLAKAPPSSLAMSLGLDNIPGFAWAGSSESQMEEVSSNVEVSRRVKEVMDATAPRNSVQTDDAEDSPRSPSAVSEKGNGDGAVESPIATSNSVEPVTTTTTTTTLEDSAETGCTVTSSGAEETRASSIEATPAYEDRPVSDSDSTAASPEAVETSLLTEADQSALDEQLQATMRASMEELESSQSSGHSSSFETAPIDFVPLQQSPCKASVANGRMKSPSPDEEVGNDTVASQEDMFNLEWGN